ncbi:MAG TPA: GH116 family glycosyl-hydrolase [Verrucomicrobiota bacterium]|nr:GH116 family glycosyl-hydrolase [Verrucomicrobiota bacterium]HNU52597.1 GH116 family glycosyl-hydrolase [Verrucomicrobiota bacterium]
MNDSSVPRRNRPSPAGARSSTRPAGFTLDRRDFLILGGLAAAGLSLNRLPVMAGPFDAADWNQIIPADKKLHPDWVKALYEPGGPAVCRKSRNELRYIGMPIGGIGCGTLYLGGDGRLWNWDIFNQKTEGVLPRRVSWNDVGMTFDTGDRFIRPRDGATFVKPAVQEESHKIAQGFALRVSSRDGTLPDRPLDATGWAEVAFTGQYPIGTVEYTDPSCPVAVKLEAFSPFIPLNADDSGLPATVFHFTVTNQSRQRVSVTLAGWLQNAACFYSAAPADGLRRNTVRRGRHLTLVAMDYRTAGPAAADRRPDILIDDFEGGYEKWKADGAAFAAEPADRASIPAYQGDLGGQGEKVVNSHASAPGEGIEAKDNQTGKLTSAPFTVQRRHLSFYIGGGRRDDAGLRLLVGGQVVRSATGHNGNAMRRDSFDIAEFEGRQAVIEIVDNAQGGWGNVGVDHIVQTDAPPKDVPLNQAPDFGTMALAVLGNGKAAPQVPPDGLPAAAFDGAPGDAAEAPAPLGAVSQEKTIGPGKTAEFRFVLSWHFPNTTLPCPDARTGNYYARRFADATAVATYVAAELPRLESLTHRWRETWYDSTLPRWFLDRTFANTSTLATTTAHRFGSGRFWAWEGVGCCPGTCTHVWHYAQAVGRLFPELERDLRERVDFGVGFDPATGVIRHRAEGTGPAVDGQCGRILGAWREHQMSADGAFLDRVWPRVKQAVEYLIRHDTDGDGILDGAQENTLDAAWYGQIAWITSLALAALRAAEAMAREQGDEPFAARCHAHYVKARAAVEKTLFNGEYFFQIPDPRREKSLGTYEACHIDQVHGQSWAWQVALGRVLDRDKTLSALRALWKYNFAPDIGPFRKQYTAGRPYALAGDAGLVMTSNPKLIPNVYGTPSWQIGYFNECMTGFEHQVASHMMAEGMTLEALAITRAIHDRYHATRRNPYNEVECSDHYARAMASYGTFIAACGFEVHGPQRHIGFAPRLSPENFRAAFTAPEGWGSFRQKANREGLEGELRVAWGQLRLRTIALEAPEGVAWTRVRVTIGGRRQAATLFAAARRLEVRLANETLVRPGQSLRIDIG